jgi:GNAT superfamily N-acetyltransferase
MTSTEITIRRGTPDDARPAFDLSLASMSDLFARQGNEWKLDPESFWVALSPFLTHLAAHAAEWWVAADPADGSMLGYARSIERGGLFELSEFFIRPDRQSAGLGRRLMERAYPLGRGDVRAIIATTDVRGLSRYYAAGTVARFAMLSLAASPQATSPQATSPKTTRSAGDLESASATVDDLPEIAAIEAAVFGFPRHADYAWLFERREPYVYRRAGRVVGFAFFSEAGQGPIAALEPADLRPILLHLEARAHACGMESISFEVPSINEVAMQHLLGRGFEIDAPLNLFMSNVPFGKFDRLIAFGPPIVL